MKLKCICFYICCSICFTSESFHLIDIISNTNIRRRQWHPTPVLLPGKSHGQRSLVGCSPWGREESDTTERLHVHFSLSCIAEGNGNPLQYSCLENPRDGWAWWAAVYGVAQSRTRLKRRSNSNSTKVRPMNKQRATQGRQLMHFSYSVLNIHTTHTHTRVV